MATVPNVALNVGIELTFTSDGSTFTKSFYGLDAGGCSDEDDAAEIGKGLARIVNGTLTKAFRVVKTPVDIG